MSQSTIVVLQTSGCRSKPSSLRQNVETINIYALFTLNGDKLFLVKVEM